jgi:hypothetical protein
MQVDKIVGVNLSEELINFLGGHRAIAEGSHIAGERLTGDDVVNGRVFVELGVGSELPNPDHLTNLLIADELFVNFFKFLLKYEVLGIFENLFAVESQNGFPDFLVESKIDTFTTVLVEALKVSVVDVDSLGVDRAVTEIVLDLTGNILSVNDFARFLFPVLNVDVLHISDHVLIGCQVGVLIANLLVV